MRIAKYMAAAGVASRRASEKIIEKGRVRINGIPVLQPGVQVDEEHDAVTVDGRRISIAKDRIYIMLNKPVGCVSTCHDDRDRMTVLDCIKGIDARLYPVGRLDFTTEGLLILTNDGDLANRLTHPSHQVGKRYYAVVDSFVSSADVKKLERGIFIEGGKTAPARIKVMKATQDRTELTITIHEGRNRQVRRMFEAIEKNVVFLKRVSVGELVLGNLKKGEYRFLSAEEVSYLKKL